MGKAVKGSKVVDETALQKSKDANQYLTENLHELSQATLSGIITLFDDAKLHINRTLEIRHQQGEGSKFVVRLNKKMSELGDRIIHIEKSLGLPTPVDDKKESKDDSQQDGSTEGAKQVGESVAV